MKNGGTTDCCAQQFSRGLDIQEMKTNGKALEDSIQMAWTLKASKLLKGMNE